MTRTWIFQHAPGEGPGYLGEMFGRDRLLYRTFHVHDGDEVPRDVDGMNALVLLGGPMSVNDPLPWIAAEQELVRRALDRGRPVLGLCLGAQIVASALGGTVGPAETPEIGWLPVRRAGDEIGELWFSGLPDEFEAFHWHGETFTLPPGAKPLASSAACANQGFVAGSALAFQCHLEMTEGMVREWAAWPIGNVSRGPTVQTPEEMLAHLEERVRTLQGIAEQVFSRWIAEAEIP